MFDYKAKIYDNGIQKLSSKIDTLKQDKEEIKKNSLINDDILKLTYDQRHQKHALLQMIKENGESLIPTSPMEEYKDKFVYDTHQYKLQEQDILLADEFDKVYRAMKSSYIFKNDVDNYIAENDYGRSLLFARHNNQSGNHKIIDLMMNRNKFDRAAIAALDAVNKEKFDERDRKILQVLLSAKASDQMEFERQMYQLERDKREAIRNDNYAKQKQAELSIAELSNNSISDEFEKAKGFLLAERFDTSKAENVLRSISKYDYDDNAVDYKFLTDHYNMIIKSHKLADDNFAEMLDAKLTTEEFITHHLSKLSDNVDKSHDDDPFYKQLRAYKEAIDSDQIFYGMAEQTIDRLKKFAKDKGIDEPTSEEAKTLGSIPPVENLSDYFEKNVPANEEDCPFSKEDVLGTISDIGGIEDVTSDEKTLDVEPSYDTAKQQLENKQSESDGVKKVIQEDGSLRSSPKHQNINDIHQDLADRYINGFTKDPNELSYYHAAKKAYESGWMPALDQDDPRFYDAEGVFNDKAFQKAQKKQDRRSALNVWRSRLTENKEKWAQDYKQARRTDKYNTDSLAQYLKDLFTNIKAHLEADGALKFFDTSLSPFTQELRNLTADKGLIKHIKRKRANAAFDLEKDLETLDDFLINYDRINNNLEYKADFDDEFAHDDNVVIDDEANSAVKNTAEKLSLIESNIKSLSDNDYRDEYDAEQDIVHDYSFDDEDEFGGGAEVVILGDDGGSTQDMDLDY